MSILTKYEKLFDTPPKKKAWLDLRRIEKLLEKLGNPENNLKGVHVAGTNGKGSVSASLQSILTQAGYKVGLFTSPHIFKMTERIRIDYQDISEKRLAKYFEYILPYVKKVKKEINDQPTWFEILTVIAILYFRDEKVDFVVFEVGLGGRLDATNVLNLGISAITDISIDHKEYLGNTIAKITKEKAGIIKSDSVVVTSNRGTTLNVIKKVCKEKKAKLIKTDKLSNKYKLKLLGEHQRRNAGIVLSAINELKEKYKISEQAIKNGFLKVKWPTRFDVRFKKLGKNKITIIIDSAHNPGGFKTLVKTFKDLKYKKAIILFSAKITKDAKQNLKILKPIILEIIFPKLKMDLMYSTVQLKKYYKNGQTMELNLAIKKAIDLALKNNLPILICGSIYSIPCYKKLID
ncbi:MAG: bifunctional folylpolyglutamate synthase/dihydrofolate synthase [Patescibacteria group bacterium]|nr:bifunctional folylpolyglutamate synthase/dihydrofolate synthase [Patescibacteria group bacterium]